MEESKMTINEIVKSEGWRKFMQKLELYTLILFAASIALYFLGSKINIKYQTFLSLALTTMAIICFFMAFISFESDSKILSFLFYRIYGIGLSIGFITIQFSLNHWPFPKEIMVYISLGLILISLFLGFREVSGENKNKIDYKFFTRISIAVISLIYLIIQKSL